MITAAFYFSSAVLFCIFYLPHLIFASFFPDINFCLLLENEVLCSIFSSTDLGINSSHLIYFSGYLKFLTHTPNKKYIYYKF